MVYPIRNNKTFDQEVFDVSTLGILDSVMRFYKWILGEIMAGSQKLLLSALPEPQDCFNDYIREQRLIFTHLPGA
jgi:hypothetical protein